MRDYTGKPKINFDIGVGFFRRRTVKRVHDAVQFASKVTGGYMANERRPASGTYQSHASLKIKGCCYICTEDNLYVYISGMVVLK